MITIKPGIRLVRCDAHGRLTEPVSDVAETFFDAARATAELFAIVGYVLPWVGYASVSGDRVVGGGHFVGRPTNERVRISFFTLCPHLRQGFGAATAAALVDLAQQEDPAVTIEARTPPRSGPSVRILRSLKFRRDRTNGATHADGSWVWKRNP